MGTKTRPLKYGDCCKENCRRTKRYTHKPTGEVRYIEYCINKGCGWKSKPWTYPNGQSYPVYIDE